MFARSPDGTRIAYDRSGQGPALVLLHGGFIQDRRSWSDHVSRLENDFTVLALDLRGHGESDRPTTLEAYAVTRVCEDVLAVLDAEGIARAHVWGFSYGASIALQLAVASAARVDRIVLGGAALGRWLTEDALVRTLAGLALFRNARAQGTVDELPLNAIQKDFATKADLDVVVAAYQAMAAWPVIEPEALKTCTLFYAGSENTAGAGMLATFGERLRAAGARVRVLAGLDHMAEQSAIDLVLPLVVEFLSASDLPPFL
jgi:pimeloyl-ACP methyl ester carboxylesterase